MKNSLVPPCRMGVSEVDTPVFQHLR